MIVPDLTDERAACGGKRSFLERGGELTDGVAGVRAWGVVSGCRVSGVLLLLLVCLSQVLADELELVGIYGSKAALMVGSGVLRTLAVGQLSPEGVRLVSIADGSVVIEVGGRRERLKLGGGPIRREGGMDSVGRAASVTLVADGRGHHVAQGSVNGAAVTFLVDTGASMVSMGRSDAIRAGVDYRRGLRGRAQTANGVVEVWRVKLDVVVLGGMRLTNVDGLVHEHELPFVLLGRSFLNRVEMQSSGDRLVLRRRY